MPTEKVSSNTISIHKSLWQNTQIHYIMKFCSLLHATNLYHVALLNLRMMKTPKISGEPAGRSVEVVAGTWSGRRLPPYGTPKEEKIESTHRSSFVLHRFSYMYTNVTGEEESHLLPLTIHAQ